MIHLFLDKKISNFRGHNYRINYLESLDESERFVDGSADGEIVHGDLAEDASVVDDEEAAQRVAVVLEVDAVVLKDDRHNYLINSVIICISVSFKN